MFRLLQRFLPLVILLFFLLISTSLIRTIFLSRNVKNVVIEEKNNVIELEKNLEDLEQKIQQATSSFELERRVRDELKLQKNDEIIINVE